MPRSQKDSLCPAVSWMPAERSTPVMTENMLDSCSRKTKSRFKICFISFLQNTTDQMSLSVDDEFVDEFISPVSRKGVSMVSLPTTPAIKSLEYEKDSSSEDESNLFLSVKKKSSLTEKNSKVKRTVKAKSIKFATPSLKTVTPTKSATKKIKQNRATKTAKETPIVPSFSSGLKSSSGSNSVFGFNFLPVGSSSGDKARQNQGPSDTVETTSTGIAQQVTHINNR